MQHTISGFDSGSGTFVARLLGALPSGCMTRELPAPESNLERSYTMKKYRITYRDEDPACPTFKMTITAYDREDAIDRFLGAPDGEGWELLAVTEIKAMRS